jgi:7-cyano-7-deazaguanine synthase
MRGPSERSNGVAVLVSGGVDSAVLAAELCDDYAAVQPVYVRSGLIWEPAEFQYLSKYLDALGRPELRPLKVLDVPVADVYADHWGITGLDVPDAQSPDEAVFLPGRNVFLISKAAVWCALQDIEALALGSLRANPFGDSTPEFDELLGEVVQRALGKRVRIVRPFSDLSKEDVLRRGVDLPLEHTFSCISPVQSAHCGRCNKCAERQRAFALAGMNDRTRYAQTMPETQ